METGKQRSQEVDSCMSHVPSSPASFTSTLLPTRNTENAARSKPLLKTQKGNSPPRVRVPNPGMEAKDVFVEKVERAAEASCKPLTASSLSLGAVWVGHVRAVVALQGHAQGPGDVCGHSNGKLRL